MKIEFFTRQYEFSHGKQPRGRGSWAFEVSEIDGHERGRAARQEEILWCNGTLGEAKRELRAKLQAAYPAAALIAVEVLP